jgi:hypothetical protein
MTTPRWAVLSPVSGLLAVIGVGLLIGLACVSAPRGRLAHVEPSAESPGAVLVTRVPVRTTAHGEAPWTDGDLPPGSHIARLDPGGGAVQVTNLTPGFSVSGRPDVSFDGRHVLFVGQRDASEPLSVWEMGIDGTELRQVIAPAGNCTAAIYLGTIYTLDAEAPVHQIALCAAGAPPSRANQLYTCHLDGTNLRQITFAPYGVDSPLALRDSRILLDIHADPAAGGESLLCTIQTDGTDISRFAAGADAIACAAARDGERTALLHSDPNWYELSARSIAPQPEPAGHSSAVDDRRTVSQVYCLNAAITGPDDGPPLSPGAVQRVQIYAGAAADAPKDGGRLLGEFPVESDGSFFIDVPPRTPLRFVTLAADGAVLRAMRNWLWVMPREARGCIGCHEDREWSPPNRFPRALRQPPRSAMPSTAPAADDAGDGP